MRLLIVGDPSLGTAFQQWKGANISLIPTIPQAQQYIANLNRVVGDQAQTASPDVPQAVLISDAVLGMEDATAQGTFNRLINLVIALAECGVPHAKIFCAFTVWGEQWEAQLRAAQIPTERFAQDDTSAISAWVAQQVGLQSRMQRDPVMLATASQKGGSAKTTTLYNMLWAAKVSVPQARILVINADTKDNLINRLPLDGVPIRNWQDLVVRGDYGHKALGETVMHLGPTNWQHPVTHQQLSLDFLFTTRRNTDAATHMTAHQARLFLQVVRGLGYDMIFLDSAPDTRQEVNPLLRAFAEAGGALVVPMIPREAEYSGALGMLKQAQNWGLIDRVRPVLFETQPGDSNVSLLTMHTQVKHQFDVTTCPIIIPRSPDTARLIEMAGRAPFVPEALTQPHHKYVRTVREITQLLLREQGMTEFVRAEPKRSLLAGMFGRKSTVETLPTSQRVSS